MARRAVILAPGLQKKHSSRLLYGQVEQVLKFVLKMAIADSGEALFRTTTELERKGVLPIGPFHQFFERGCFAILIAEEGSEKYTDVRLSRKGSECKVSVNDFQTIVHRIRNAKCATSDRDTIVVLRNIARVDNESAGIVHSGSTGDFMRTHVAAVSRLCRSSK